MVNEKLVMSIMDKAPTHPDSCKSTCCNANLNGHVCLYSSAVKQNCFLRVDLSEIPKQQFKEANGPEGKYLKLNFKLLIRIEGARLAFSFACAGKEYASVEADYH
jgi:hypothetical protein